MTNGERSTLGLMAIIVATIFIRDSEASGVVSALLAMAAFVTLLICGLVLCATRGANG